MTTTYPKPKGWPNPRLEQVTALKARNEKLEAEAAQLLERAQRAEAAEREAVAREAAIHQRAIVSASDGVGDFLSCMFCGAYCKPGETMKEHEADCPIAHPSEAAATLLERLAELETQVEQLETTREEQAERIERLRSETGKAHYTNDCHQKALSIAEQQEQACKATLEHAVCKIAELRGALQAALTPLERAADALVPPGARVGTAAAMVEETIVVIREELE